MQSLVPHYVIYSYGVAFICLMGLVAYVRIQTLKTRKFLKRCLAHESNSKIKA